MRRRDASGTAARRPALRRALLRATAGPRPALLEALRRIDPATLDRRSWTALLDAWEEDLADAAVCLDALAAAEARCADDAERLAESEAAREEAWNGIAFRDGRLAALTAADPRPGSAAARRRGAPPTILILIADVTVGGAVRLLGEILRRLPDWRFVTATTAAVPPGAREAWDWLPAANVEPHPRPTDADNPAWRRRIHELVATRHVDAVWLVNNAFGYRLLAELRGRFPDLVVVDHLLGRAGPVHDHLRHRRRIDATIVESAEMRSFLIDSGDDPERVHVAPSGLDPAPCAAARAAAPPHAGFVAGYSGRLSEEKNPLGFVALAERLRDRADIRFVMTGDGPLAETVDREVAARGIGARFHRAGLVDDALPWLAGYDALVLPSREDGRPQVVLEAFAMGIPAAASRVGGLAELVRDGETGFLCDPWDVDAFARSILLLADRPDLRRAMGERARRFVVAELDPALMARRYAAVFARLLGLSTEDPA